MEVTTGRRVFKQEHVNGSDALGDVEEEEDTEEMDEISEQETQLIQVLIPHDDGSTASIYVQAVHMDIEHLESAGETEREYDETSTIQLEPEPPPAQHDDDGQQQNSNIDNRKGVCSELEFYAFKCDLCQNKFEDQFSFFEHLRTHYDNPDNIEKPPSKSPPLPDLDERHEFPVPHSPRTLREKLKLLKKQRKKTPHQSSSDSTESECVDDEERMKGYCEVGTERKDTMEGNVNENECIEVKEEMDSDEAVEVVDLEQVESPVNPGLESQLDCEENVVRRRGRPKNKKDVIPCSHCKERFDNMCKMKAHKKLVHDEDGGSCSSSRNKGSTRSDLPRSERLRLRVSSLKCKECSKVFNHKNSLVYHMKSHTNERNHECGDCGKKFLTSSALNVHTRLHTGEKPYLCQHCSKPFRQWGDLAYHMVSLHSNVRAYVCEFCGKDFARKYSLTVHRRIHTLERDYACEFCTKSFRAASYLQSHRRIHTGEKPHNCDVCGKPFRVKSDMKRHRQSHNRHEPKSRGVTGERKGQNGGRRDVPVKRKSKIRIIMSKRDEDEDVDCETKEENVEESVEESVMVHNLVAVDESGRIIELEPGIAEQLRAGQVIQVPLPTSSSGRSTQRIVIGSEEGCVITGDLDINPNDEDLKEERGVGVELFQHAVITQDPNNLAQGSLYVWPAFM